MQITENENTMQRSHVLWSHTPNIVSMFVYKCMSILNKTSQCMSSVFIPTKRSGE